MYGLKGKGWIISLASFKGHVGLTFFGGPAMKPPPPEGKSRGMRRVNLRHMSEVDDPKVRSWIEQAEHLPGWGNI